MPTIATANLPTRTGYTFVGFYDINAETGGTQYYTSTGASAHTWDKVGDQTLYARWTAQTSTVTLNKNTSSSDTTTVATVTATYDAAMPHNTIRRWVHLHAHGIKPGTKHFTRVGHNVRRTVIARVITQV